MAIGIVITVLEKVFGVLNNKELREFCSMFGYKSELDYLKETVSTIKVVLLDADSNNQELTHEIKDYIEKLKYAVYDIDDLLDEFNTMVQKNNYIKGRDKISKKVRRFFSRSNQLLVAYNMSYEIKNLNSKLDKIVKDRQFRLNDVYVPVKRKQETMSFVGENSIIGREDDMEAIVKMLVGDYETSNNGAGQKVSYVSIVGVGGIGKTALAQMVYNDKRVVEAFELKLWVCVSDDFDFKKLFRHMLREEGFNMEGLHRKVQKKIERKRYLLVLDDVWCESRDEWEKLRCFLDLGGRGSRVVITCRSKKVAKAAKSDLMHELKGLSEENSWNLFKNLAFEPGKEPMSTSDHLFDIGKEIVKKCANVPLAIRVAASMVFDQDESKWIALKNANLMEMEVGSENGIMPILKYSYYHLTPALKSCFSLCALFPKDSIIYKETLVRWWLAQGCLDQPHGYQVEEDVGDEYVSILLQRCFLQEVVYDYYGEIKYCKMHDLMHDLAQEVAGKETILLDSPKDLLDKSIHLSFTFNGVQLLTSPLTQFGKLKTLRTFITRFGGKFNPLESNILAVCSHLKRLRVLDLSGYVFNTLPHTVGNLSHLRYLDLKYHRELTVLPNSITRLYNLQVLDLDCTGVRELPLDTRKLVNLRHLSLRDCTHLMHMSPGLDTLTSLRTLSCFVVGKETSDGGNIGKLRDLSALVNLRGELNIIFNNDSSCDVENYRQVELLKRAHLKKLGIQFNEQGTIDETLLACLQPHGSRLRKIQIHSYKGLKLPSWVEYLGTSLPNIVKIHLTNFDSLQILPSLSQLRHLKYLDLEAMPNVEFMEESNVVFGSSDDEPPFFLSLEQLELNNFPKLKGWWREETSKVRGEMGSSSVVVPSFPSLRNLTLCDCPSLTTLPSCPKLRELELYKCHETLTLFENKSAVPALPGHSTTSPGPSSSSPSSGPLLYMDYVGTDNIIGTLDCLFGKSLGGITHLTISDFEGESLSILEEKHGVYGYNYGIKKLGLIKCPNLKSLAGVVDQLSSLENLAIEGCENLELENNNNHEGAVTARTSWESLHLLSELSLEDLPKLINLPKEFQYLTSLQYLTIEACENLEALPDGIAHLRTLKYLYLRGCNKLTRRCQRPDGEDWPKISHIPHLFLNI